MTAPALTSSAARPARRTRGLHASISSAIVAGWIGAAFAWLLCSSFTDLSSLMSSYARLDQLVALCLGASTGACVLALRARHRREPVLAAFGAGALLGGVAALLGATIGLVLRLGDSPLAFVLQRVGTWALMSAAMAAALACYTRSPRALAIAESAMIGVIGGVTAGAIFTLPGPAEVWWPIAMTLAGAAVGFAAVGPNMWRAPAVVHVLSSRERRHTFWSLHERTIDDGWSMPVAEGHVACVEGHVYVYPPPAGAILDGYPLYRAMPLAHDVMLAIGRSRFRIALGKRS